jgi:peptidyl-prolyl cis-trans isomerase D
MAKSVTKKASNAVVWVILILLMIGLAGFGATNFGGSLRSIGSVGKTEIEVTRYARELEQELRSLQAQTGQNITLSQAQAFGVDRAVLQRLIGAAALENEVARIGISVGDAEVQRQVLQTPAFQGIDGKFDREAYEFALDRAGLTPTRFEEAIRKDVSRNILQTAVSGGVAAPAAFTDALIGYVGERRSFSWAKLDRSALATPLPEPGEAELQAYYAANAERFALPEARDITYAWLSPDQIVDQVEVDEAALQALYDERSAEFNQPERRLVEQLVFGTEDEAAAASAALQAGSKTFENLVNERGLTLPDVDLGDMSKDDLGPAGDAVFALAGPGVTGPVTTDLGPAIIRVNAILPAQVTPFEDARGELKDELTMDRARRMIGDQIEVIDDLLAGGATLEDVAKETDMVLGQVDWTPEMSDGLTAYDGFRTVAEAATVEDFPEVHQLDDGGIFAMRLNKIVPSRPEPYETAVVRVIEAWEADKLREALNLQATEIKAQLDNGARISSLGLPVSVETRITRDAFIEDASPEFLAQVFLLPADGSVVVDVADGVLIGQLEAILPADREDLDAKALAVQLDEGQRQSIANDLLDGFTLAMEAQAGITLNQSAINAVHAQFP